VTHLGEKVSALVDGQLSLEATERAHAHLAHCRGCRDLAETERLLKARLTRLPAPAPDADLVGRLLALGGPTGPLPPRPGHVPGSPRPPQVPLPALTGARSGGGGRPPASGSGRAAGSLARPTRVTSTRPSTYSAGSSRPAGHPVARRRARLAGAVLGALGVVGAGVTGLVLATPDAPAGPARAPFDSFVVQFPLRSRGPVTTDVSLQLRQNRPLTVQSAERTDSGR
jgi:hypothetical protein